MKARESLNEGNNVVKSCSTRDQTTHQSIIEQLETKIVLEQLMHLLQSQDISKVKDLSEIIAKLSQKRHELNWSPENEAWKRTRNWMWKQGTHHHKRRTFRSIYAMPKLVSARSRVLPNIQTEFDAVKNVKLSEMMRMKATFGKAASNDTYPNLIKLWEEFAVFWHEQRWRWISKKYPLVKSVVSLGIAIWFCWAILAFLEEQRWSVISRGGKECRWHHKKEHK